ncbi:MAG: NUDIX hydrolase [Verrucomicrobiaceae bacterium]|nr:NUDIX hydrolase [Verrucomicrobiaceae bacterium]
MTGAPPSPTSPQIGPSRVVYENKYQTVTAVRVNFGSFEKEIFVNDHGIRAGVLFVRGNEVLMVSQYRLLPRDMAWEIPGGRIDAHEAPEAGAMREALEETGLRGRVLHPLVFFIPGLDTCDNPTHAFWCDDFEAATAGGAHGDPHEIEGQAWLPFQECLDMVFNRRIMDSMTITALLAWQAVQSRVPQASLSSPS